MTKEQANSLLDSHNFVREQRISLSELLYKRGLIDKPITEQVVITSFSNIAYLILENRLDLLFLPQNRKIVLDFLQQIGMNVNESFPILCGKESMDVLPFCFSLQFLLAMAIEQDFAVEAVEMWMMIIGCQCDFVNGMLV